VGFAENGSRLKSAKVYRRSVDLGYKLAENSLEPKSAKERLIKIATICRKQPWAKIGKSLFLSVSPVILYPFTPLVQSPAL